MQNSRPQPEENYKQKALGLLQEGYSANNCLQALEYFTEAIKLYPDYSSDLRAHLRTMKSVTPTVAVRNLWVSMLLECRFGMFEDAKLNLVKVINHSEFKLFPLALTPELFTWMTDQNLSTTIVSYFNLNDETQIDSLLIVMRRLNNSLEGQRILQNVLWQGLIPSTFIGGIFSNSDNLQKKIFTELNGLFQHGDVEIEMEEVTRELFQIRFEEKLNFRTLFKTQAPVLYKKMCEKLEFEEPKVESFYKTLSTYFSRSEIKNPELKESLLLKQNM